MKHHDAKDRSTQLAMLLGAVIVLALVAAIVLVSFTYHTLVLDNQWAISSDWLKSANVEARAAALGQLGDYFGGTLNPILSFSGFLVLLLTVVLQRRQLQEGTRQLEQSTRSIDLEAFVRVNDLLQTPECIASREVLYILLGDDSGQPKPLAHWTRAERQAAETVGRQFELVGLLVHGRLFEPSLFLSSWGHTLQRCWSACLEMVADRRLRQADPGFWRHFEELQALASKSR